MYWLAMPTQSHEMLSVSAGNVISTVMCVCCAGAVTSLTWSNAAFDLPSPVLAQIAAAATTSPLPDQVCSTAIPFTLHTLVCCNALTHATITSAVFWAPQLLFKAADVLAMAFKSHSFSCLVNG